LAACRRHGIPTVFWNKEDPAHFDDFVEVAGQFDVILTTAVESAELYRSKYAGKTVDVLPFAASMTLHNPIQNAGRLRDGDIVFAGMYFRHKFEPRRRQIGYLLDGAVRSSMWTGSELVILSRFGGRNKNYRFPLKYQQYVKGSLPYPKMLSAYREYKVVLNANSVTNSETMLSRRVFEALASGAAVVSGECQALSRFFSRDVVPIAHSTEEAAAAIAPLINSTELRERSVHIAQREIWARHTYENRARKLFATAGLSAAGSTENDQGPGSQPDVTVLLVTNRPHFVGQAFQLISRQVGVDIELLVGIHGRDPQEFWSESGLSPEHPLRSETSAGAVRHIETEFYPQSLVLGECLQNLLEKSRGDYIAKMDDDDFYGPCYLADAVNALRFSGADLVGKKATYVHFGSKEALALRNAVDEHRWVDLVSGPTMVGVATSMRRVGFRALARGEDTDFQLRLRARGARIYSADRFNFLRRRGVTGDHTWSVSDSELLTTSQIIAFSLTFGEAAKATQV